jgi:predicted acyl esterase
MMGEVQDGMLIDWDVPIEMDDGVVLRADIFRPVGDEPVPVILSHGPYAKGWRFQDGYPSAWEAIERDHPEVLAGSTNKYQQWEVVDPEKWVPDGYACVRVDSRGAGRSPGYLDHFSPRETSDFAACIEWAGTRDWSNGRVGLTGISYYAINQWQVASRQPEHLAAICPFEGAADFYRDMTHHGGIYTTFWDNWSGKQIEVVQHGLGERGPVNPNNGVLICGDETLPQQQLDANRADCAAQILSRPIDSEWYRERSADWDRITVPILSAGNWGGHALHLRGNVEGFVRAASTQKWLEIHGRPHWTEFYTDYGVAMQKQFFAHFLKGEDNGWDQRPPVHLRVRTVDGFVDRDEGEWPLARTDWQRLYLDAATTELVDSAPADGADITYAASGDGVTFSLSAFEQDTELTGPMAAKLFVSSSTDDADLFVVVRAFDPDGGELLFHGANDPHTPLAQGWLRASHRALDQELSTSYRPYHTHDRVEPLGRGEVVEIDIEIWPTSVVVPADYRLALTVRSRDYEWDGPPAFLKQFANPLRGCGPLLHDDPTDRPATVADNELTVHTGGTHQSHLIVPVVPPRR